ncbi:MAG: hypothetical protein Q4C71_06385, partial [Microbacteriaceae bacterium]|nr:hypothetical protein [Microbacteriaceae bacterium]
ADFTEDSAVALLDTSLAPNQKAVTLAYQIVREALTNVLRHANEPSLVQASLGMRENLLIVEVVDDGRSVPGDGVKSGAPGLSVADLSVVGSGASGAGALAEGLGGGFGAEFAAAGYGTSHLKRDVSSLGGSLHSAHGVDGGWRLYAEIPVILQTGTVNTASQPANISKTQGGNNE